MRRTDADTARIARCANTARQLSAQVKITDFMVLRAAEAVSNAVRISANRLYAKGHGKTSGDELRLDGGPDANTHAWYCQRSVDQAFKASAPTCVQATLSQARAEAEYVLPPFRNSRKVVILRPAGQRRRGDAPQQRKCCASHC